MATIKMMGIGAAEHVSLSRRQLDSDDALLRLLPSFAPLELVTRLDLSRNRLSSLPMALASLKALESLNVASNALTSVPDCIFQLFCLRSLDLSRNRIISPLPLELAELVQLERLKLDANEFYGTIPIAYATLVNLRSLILGSTFGGNAISTISSGVLPYWTCLTELDASYNQLQELPDDLLLAPELLMLSLSHNKLDTFPIPQRITLTKSRLRVLNLSNNLLCKLPATIAQLQLELLDLSGNSLCFVSLELLDVMRRQCVTVLLTGNPFTKVPMECASQLELTLTGTSSNLLLHNIRKRTKNGHHHYKRYNRKHSLRRHLIQYEEDSASEASLRQLQQQRGKLMSIEDLPSALSTATSTTSLASNASHVGADDSVLGSLGILCTLATELPSDHTFDRNRTEISVPCGLSPQSYLPELLTSPPTLAELCARVIHNYAIPYSEAILPPLLYNYLSDHAHAAPCASCSARFAQQWVSAIAVENIAGHYLLPVHKRFCSLKCLLKNLSQRTSDYTINLPDTTSTIPSTNKIQSTSHCSTTAITSAVALESEVRGGMLTGKPTIVRSMSKMWIVDPDELEDDRVAISWQ